MNNKKQLDFYRQQGIRTIVEEETFIHFPKSISKTCRIIQGLLIHPLAVKNLYNLQLPPERMAEGEIETVQEMIDKIKELDSAPLVMPRVPEKEWWRFVVNIQCYFVLS